MRAHGLLYCACYVDIVQSRFGMCKTQPQMSKSLLFKSLALTLLLVFEYIACRRRTIHSYTPRDHKDHHKTLRGTLSQVFSRSTKAKYRIRFLSSRSRMDKNFSWSWRASPRYKDRLQFINQNQLTDHVWVTDNLIHDPLHDFHHMLCSQFEPSVVTHV